MPQSQQTFPKKATIIEPRPCVRCDTQMVLSHIEADKPGFDRRTFECAKCHHTETIVMQYR